MRTSIAVPPVRGCFQAVAPAGALAFAVLVAIPTTHAVAQQRPSPTADRDGHPFRSPTVSPLEAVYRLAPVQISRGERDRLVALAELGDQFPFWIHRRPEGPFELSGTVLASAASRFDVEGAENEFIEINYRVGVSLRARFRKLAARLELYHVSSHLGDEFLLDTGTEPISTSREGLELLVQGSPVSGMVLYGGGGLLFRSTLPFRTPSVRMGAEWERARDAFARPYVAVDAFVWSELDWDPRIAAEVGAALGRGGRLGLIFGFGPSRAEQFFRESETLYGISFSFRR